MCSQRLLPVVLACCATFGNEAGAQFQIPLPPHVSPDSAYHIQSAVCDSVRHKGRLAAMKPPLNQKERFTRRLGDAGHAIKVTPHSCRAGTWLHVGKVFQNDTAIRTIYGGGSVDLLGDVASTFKSEQLFVQTAIVGGTIGPVYFRASYGQLFSSEESEDPDVSPEELRDNTSTMLRLIQNGGSATARVIVPLVWGGGAASQQAAGAYLNVGVVGPVSESDSLRATAGLTTELLASFAIRHITTYDVDADLFLGIRPGFQYVFGPDGILPENDSKMLPFCQFAGGLRIGGQSRISVLVTAVPRRYRDFVPDVQFNVQFPGS